MSIRPPAMTPRSGYRPPTPVASGDTLEENLSIETAEQVTLSLPIAGLFNRSLASLIDHVILAIIALLLVLLDQAVALRATLGDVISIIIGASLYGAYFLGSEFFMQGQTLGKRAVKLRVVDHQGRPATPTQILIRNLIRPADLLLTLLGIELFFIFWTPRNLRLGDIAAGTIVIREIPTKLDDIRETLERQQFYKSTAVNVGEGGATSRRLSREEKDLVLRFFERATTISPPQREELANRILQRIEGRIGPISATAGLPAFERLRQLWLELRQESRL